MGVAHLLNIGALDYDGQAVTLFNSQTHEIESPPSIIVALNGWSSLLKELLSKLNYVFLTKNRGSHDNSLN